MIWNAKNIAKLRALAATGISYTEIGKELGITKNAAIGKARRLKIGKSKANPPAHKPRPIKPPPPPPPPPPAPVPDMKLLTMMELRDNHCRYPINGRNEMLFCGRHQDGKEPYCKQHAKICYGEPKIKPRSGRTF